MTLPNVQAIGLAEDARKRAIEAFLERHGWTHTCKTPGSYWLWEKDLGDGRVALVSGETAVHLQAGITPCECDEFAEEYSETCPLHGSKAP